jgi:hypothetical protein
VRKAEQFGEAQLIRVAGGGIPVRLDPVGMLDAQGVVDVLLELDVRVDFVRHGQWLHEGSKCGAGRQRATKLAALHWSERTEPSARSPSVLAHYCTLTSIGFGFFATALFGR